MLLAVLVGTLVLNQVWPGTAGQNLSYTEFISAVKADKVSTFDLTNGTNSISGQLTDGTRFTSTVRDNFPDNDERALLAEHGVNWSTKQPQSNWLLSWARIDGCPLASVVDQTTDSEPTRTVGASQP